MSRVIQVFDPPMCCATGVCGPSVDPALVRFAADLEWLKEKGVEVERYNLAQQPEAFANNTTVVEALNDYGTECLPLIIVGNEIKAQGKYPSREELMAWVEVTEPPSLFTDAVAELVAIGAAIAANCQSCFRYHYDKARKLGVSKEDMLAAVQIAQTVKMTPATAILQLASAYLEKQPTKSTDDSGLPSCCDKTQSPTEKSGCCC